MILCTVSETGQVFPLKNQFQNFGELLKSMRKWGVKAQPDGFKFEVDQKYTLWGSNKIAILRSAPKLTVEVQDGI